MKVSRIYSIFLRQVFLFKSNPIRLVNIFSWSVLSIIQWGFISKYLGTFGGATFSFATAVLGAIILWEFLQRIQQGIMGAFLEDVWSQNFINFFASPLELSEYVLGMIATSILTSVFGFGFLLLIAGLFFGFNMLIIGLYALPFLVVLFMFGIAMGILIATIIFRWGPSAEWIAWPIPFALSIVSGVFYPISLLPGSLQIISKLLPSSYVFESARMIISGNFTIWQNLFIAVFLCAAYLLLMYFFFWRVYCHNLKTGAIARFSAES